MAVQRFANCPDPADPTVPQTTLDGSITDADVTLTVLATPTALATPNFQIVIDSEILLVTAVSGVTWTVTRGTEGSVAAAHSTGASIYAPLTAAGLALLPAAVSTTGIVYGGDTTFARSSVGVMKLSAASATSLLLQNGAAVEVGALSWSGNNFIVGTQGGVGAGTPRDTILGAAASAPNGLYFATEATSRWNVSTTGHLRPVATATYDLGTATEVLRSAYLAKLGTLTSNGLVTTSAGDGTLGITALGSNVATFLSTPSSANLLAAITDETGSGLAVFNTSPTFVTPLLGTPTSGVLSNCTGYPTANLTGLGTNVAAFLATPSSANLAAALTDETGTGAAVFATAPALTGPIVLTEVVGSSALTITGATQVTSFPALSITQTWNNSGTTFTGVLLVNVTNTASATGSKIFDFQIGGVSSFNMTRQNIATFAGSASFNGTVTSNGSFVANQAGGSLSLGAVGTNLVCDTDYTFGIRNGTNPFKVRIYNTFTTHLTVGEWFKQDWRTTTNQFRFGTCMGTSTGTARVASWDYGGLEASPTAAITVPITSGPVVIDTLTVTNATILSSTLAANGTITMGSGVGIATNTGTGTILATATSQKLGFWGTAAVIQPAAAGQAAFTDSTGGIAAASLVDVTTAAVTDPVKTNANFATISVLLLAMRTALTSSGIMKGAA